MNVLNEIVDIQDKDGWDKELEGWESISNSYEINDYELDLIIVLAGGINNEGKLHIWVQRRLERAIELHKIYKAPILCCGGGTYHKPPYINKDGFVVHESTECVNYLIQRGIKPENILREWSSYDTIANAFFSLTNHLWCNDEWKNIAIITSEFHMPRTKEIFNWVFNLKREQHEQLEQREKQYNLYYYPVSDLDIDQNMLTNRIEREKNSRNNVIKLRDKIKNIKEFHKWLYTEHNAYNNKPIIKENISEKCKESY